MSATAVQPNGSGTALAKADPTEMTYTPFGDKTAIKLNVQIVQSLISAKTTQGHVASREECIKFMMLCRARGLNPFEGDAYLVGYDGKDGPKFSLITAHQAFLKRAEMHPEYDGMESGVIVKDAAGNLVDREGDFVFDDDFILGGWAIVHFKGRKYPMKKRAKLATYTTGKSRWAADPAGMIVKVAEADALRSSFPTLLGGCYTEAEMPIPTEPVSARSEPAELPTGRHAVRRKVAAPPIVEPQPPVDEAPIDVESTPIEDPTGDAAQHDLELVVSDMIERANQCATTGELDKMRGEWMKARAGWGEALSNSFKAAWDKRYKELTAKK